VLRHHLIAKTKPRSSRYGAFIIQLFLRLKNKTSFTYLMNSE